jgi:beta-lysine 5,6-aminomutase beta subunit
VLVPDLVARAVAEKADAVLVSQVVTQRDAHLTNTREMAAAFRDELGDQRPLLVVGGPRFDPGAAGSLGVDQVFSRGTMPSDVASYLVHALAPVSEPEGAAVPGLRSDEGVTREGGASRRPQASEPGSRA